MEEMRTNDQWTLQFCEGHSIQEPYMRHIKNQNQKNNKVVDTATLVVSVRQEGSMCRQAIYHPMMAAHAAATVADLVCQAGDSNQHDCRPRGQSGV